MKLIKVFILSIALLMIGAELKAEVGLKDESLVEVKPKTCDFQWWKGSKNYDAAGSANQKTGDQTNIKK